MIAKKVARKKGWLQPNVIRGGIKEQWAAKRNEDSLSVSIRYKGGGYIVTRTVVTGDGVTLSKESHPLETIEAARDLFSAATRSLIRGIYPTE